MWVMARLQRGKWNVSCDLFSESESQKGNHHEQRKIYLGHQLEITLPNKLCRAGEYRESYKLAL